MRDIFAPYGPLDLVQIQRDGAGKSQGHGYVTCASLCRLPLYAAPMRVMALLLCNAPCQVGSVIGRCYVLPGR